METEKHGIEGRQGTLLLPQESYLIRGAIFAVYKKIGTGFLESVYQECLELEFQKREIPHVSQAKLQISYEDAILKQYYKPDFLCFGQIIVELKSVNALLPEHEAQVLNYLRATRLHLGLLVNFNHSPGVEIKRLVM